MSHLHYDKKILNRVKRIQGQMTAVEKSLLNPESSCIDVLQQVAAVKGAVNGLMNQLMELHLKEHVLKDVDHVNDEEVQKFLALLQRYL
ncbi:metal/formaldehyde-sensitive transcriptional repressor [Acinetobacter tjernbergiae]|uniref:Transcriptional repressor rcnR n=1 Tax=Acinetobacter tjernbergiae DSM 14971 = CIP 107465 TaxID=1120928 RepID=V2URK3_9GAMM|nr:metal/formaldehyde-sensitive transcriptional repressor [Acinetobacter tjernbergiae]ESK57353.1 hypothetical protein F990_00269 [Acinetobacter tjernbergiae DSM 14971 = CIP 107465]